MAEPTATRAPTGAQDLLARFTPTGRALSDEVWQARHRLIVGLVLAHAVFILGFALWMGFDLAHSVLEASIVAAAGGVALVHRAGRTVRASAASLGLLSSSAILVHLSGGFIEMHFHFFVVIPIIALYQHWTPFLLAITYVVVHHGVFGTLDPASVYNHPDAIANPWTWASIHAVFILGIVGASLASWRLSETAMEAREALAQQTVEQERSEKALRMSLLRTASHELKTPITPLQIQVELLRTGMLGPLNPGQQRSVEMLDRNIVRLGSLVTDVLDVTRLQEGRLALRLGEVDLGVLVRDAAAIFEGPARQRSITLVAAAPEGLMVHGDATRLAQVLTNLLSNAVKFTPPGGTVRLEARREGPEAVVSVRDTGVGLRPDQAARLFQPFARVHEDQGAPGTGLGLYICRGQGLVDVALVIHDEHVVHGSPRAAMARWPLRLLWSLPPSASEEAALWRPSREGLTAP